MKATLAVDIGNSNITFAKFVDGKVEFKGNFQTFKGQSPDFFEKQFELPGASGLFTGLNNIAIASVVPELDDAVNKFMLARTGLQPVWINPSNCLGLNLDVSEPETVGADRIANAIAARKLYGTPVLVVDVGTATSFDFVAADGSFAGGVIMPGPKISFDALRAKASKLKDISLDWPKQVIGKNTAEAINSGVHFGHMYAVEGLVAAAKREHYGLHKVIVTGGAGSLLLENSAWFSVYDPDLTLKGIEIVANNDRF